MMDRTDLSPTFLHFVGDPFAKSMTQDALLDRFEVSIRQQCPVSRSLSLRCALLLVEAVPMF